MNVFTICVFVVSRQRDVESHSQQCSTAPHDRTMTSSTMTTETLLVSVTRTPSATSTWAPFKVITKVSGFVCMASVSNQYTE